MISAIAGIHIIFQFDVQLSQDTADKGMKP